jgi:hypothetical protein
MNAFESLVATLLEHDGFWVKPSFKVELTKEEKVRVGRPSSPRWELDIVAYKGASNELLVVECKSYLDSPGVRFKGFVGTDETRKARYKLFNDSTLRETVLQRLECQLVASGACAPSPSIHLCLAAGRIATEEDRESLRKHFEGNNWRLLDYDWLRERLVGVSQSGYEDDIAAIVAKLLLKDRRHSLRAGLQMPNARW